MFGMSSPIEKLRKAIVSGRTDDMEKILSSQKISLGEKDQNGRTLLLLAVSSGHSETVQLLVEKGVDVNAGSNKRTPLSLAIRNGYSRVAKMLIEAGADINKKDGSGYTPLIAALYYGLSLDIIPMMIEKVTNIEERDPDHQKTALFWAASRGYTEILDMMIAKKADLNSPDPYGNTPLTEAISSDHNDETAILLIQSGADVNFVDSNKFTPLMLACQKGRTDVINLLIEKKADINYKNNAGRTALLVAVEEGNLDIVTALLAKGASINVEDDNGDSALIIAIKQGHTKIAELLIDKGIDINLEDAAGDTALTLARRNRQVKITKKLKELSPPAPTSISKKKLKNAGETWIKIGSDKMAHVGVYPEIQRKITEIFNFTSREKILISENLASKSEAITPAVSFDDMNDDILRQAFKAFVAQGGEATEASVFRYAKLDKTTSPRAVQ